MTAIRISILSIRLVMRTKTVLFFAFVFPLVWLFVFEGIFAHGDPKAIMYFFGPVVTLNIMGSAFWGLGLQSVMQRERGILRRYRLAPINSVSIVAANLLANYLLELPTIALLVFFAKVVFHMPLAFGWGTLFVLVTVGTFGFAGFGLTIASIANTMQEAQIYNNLVWVSLLFLSGATIPLPLLPHWIQRVATFLPATYLVTSFQAVMIRSEPLAKHLPEMLALVISGIFGLLFAWKLFRWEKEEKIPNSSKAWAVLFIFPFVLIGLWMTLYSNPTKAWASTYSLLGRGPGAEKTGAAVQRIWPIEDFDKSESMSSLKTKWRVNTERAAGAPPDAALILVSPGAEGSVHALGIEGQLERITRTDQAQTLAEYHLAVPPDAANAGGVELWLRGDGHACRVELDSAQGQKTTPSEMTLVPPPTWERIKIPFPPGPSGISGNSAGRWILRVAAAGAAGKFSLGLDQIALYASPKGQGRADPTAQ